MKLLSVTVKELHAMLVDILQRKLAAPLLQNSTFILSLRAATLTGVVD